MGAGEESGLAISTGDGNSPLASVSTQLSAKPGRNGHSWKPGESGNPSGRPLIVAHVRDLARLHTPEVIASLAAILRDPCEHGVARVAAGKELLNRAWGQSPQALLVGRLEGLSNEQLLELLPSAIEALSKAKGEGNGDGDDS